MKCHGRHFAHGMAVIASVCMCGARDARRAYRPYAPVYAVGFRIVVEK